MSNPEQSPQPEPVEIRSLVDVAQAAGKLAAKIFEAADGLAQASTDVALEVNTALDGTELMENWPLSGRFGLRNLFRSRVMSAFGETSSSVMNAESVAGLDQRKYYASHLQEVYPDIERPALAVSADLIRWTEGMARKGHELLVTIDLGEDNDSRLEVRVYEDQPVSRSSLRDYTDDLEDESDQVTQWVSDRVLVSGLPDEVALLRQATQVD